MEEEGEQQQQQQAGREESTVSTGTPTAAGARSLARLQVPPSASLSASEKQQQQQQRRPVLVASSFASSSSSSIMEMTTSATSQQRLLRQQAHSPAAVMMSSPEQTLRRRAPSEVCSTSHAAAVPAPNPPVVPSASVSSRSVISNASTSSSVVSRRTVPSDVDVRHRRLHHPIIPERDMEDDEGTILEFGAVDNNNFTTLSGWTEVELSREPGNGGTPPSPRSLHAAAVLNGTFYVWGGFDGTQRVNTFHAFSFAEKRWSPVLPSAHSSPPPSPRDRHVAVSFGTSFYIHGGFDGRSRVSDFWCFDFSTMCWREINSTPSTTGRPPSARHSHSAVVHGNSLYIAFGYDGSYKSDVHEFDFVQSHWSAVPAAGRRPRARYRATAVVHKNYMIVYGGHDGVRHLSDTHIFDFDTKTWSSLVTEGTPPIPRDSHLSVMHGNSMFVCFGSSGSAMNDLHELQLMPSATATSSSPWPASTPARWRAVSTASRGFQPRPRFCHVGVVYNSSLYVFGGYDGGDRLNDFCHFDFTVYDLSFEIAPSTLIPDLRAMINDSTMSDITFIVEGSPVYAHKVLLMRCSYFQALFLGQMRESRQSEIELSQVRKPVFLYILEYIYTDQLRIPLNLAMEIFEAADLFCIPRLKTMCEKRMLQSITVENAAAIFYAADLHSAHDLREKSKNFILSHFEEVSKSSCFEQMGRNDVELVFELLQSR